MALKDDITEAFKQGEIPTPFIEEQRLLPEDSPAAEKFVAAIAPVYDRLLTAMGKKPEDHPVRFRLSANNSPNAFIVTKTSPPLVTVTAGLIKALENESELAAVLAHELGHDFFHEKLGDHENGKIEESGADIFAVDLLRKADYPQDALRKVLSRFDQKNSMLGTLLDPHPAIETRIPIIQTAERALVRGAHGKGEQKNIRDRPIHEDLKAAVSEISYKSYVGKLLEREGFQDAAEQDKAAILKKLLDDGLCDTDPYYENSRIQDLADAMAQVKSEANPEAFNELVDTLILRVNGDVLPHYYVPLQTGKADYTIMWKPSPIGSMQVLQDEINNFTAASTPDDIRQGAENINKLLSRYPPESNIGKISIRGFLYPKDMGSVENPVESPWHAHVEEVLKGNDVVLEALTRLAVTWLDPRLKQFPEVPYLRSAAFGASGNVPLFNRKGQLCGTLDAKATDSRLAWEKEILEERAKEEQDMLDHVDWQRVGTDFDGFIKDYAAQLHPGTSLIYAKVAFSDGSYPFAERFLSQAVAVMEANPNDAGYKNRLKDYVLKAVKNSFRHKGQGEGLSEFHPFVAFVQENSYGLFTTREKINTLSKVRSYKTGQDGTEERPEDLWCLPHEKIFSGLPKQNLAELKEWFISDFKEVAEQLTEEDYEAKKLLVDIARYETLRTIRQDAVISLEDVAFLREIESFQGNWLTELDKELEKAKENFTQAYSQSANPDNASSPAKLLENFAILSAERAGADEYSSRKLYRPSVFAEQPDLLIKYQDTIKKVMESASAEMRVSILEGLLFRKNISVEGTQPLLCLDSDLRTEDGVYTPLYYDGSLADPDFKNRVIKGYAGEIASSLGIDDGSQAYASRFKEQVNRLTSSASTANAVAILQELSRKECGNRMLLQEECASYIKETIESSNLGEAVKQNFQATVGEGALLALSGNVERREATLDFLTKPFSKENAEKFKEQIKDPEDDNRPFSFEDFISPDVGNKLFGKFLSESAHIEQIHKFHKAFWDLPFEMRMLAIKQVVFKESKKKDALQKQLDVILDRTLPVTNDVETQRARQVVETYLEATPDDEDKRLITSAMLVSTLPSNKALHEKMSVGKGLNLVLGAIDPAGDKVKQAIESHPSTPESIRVEFKDSKTAAKDPLRHQIIDWVVQSNKALPDEQKITRVGRVLGAGSYGITVEGERPDGTSIARTLLYPDVREKAENEFGILKNVAAILAEKNPVFAPVQEMIRQAANMSHIETDMNIAAKQAEVAAKLYDDMKVTVEGEEFTFAAAEYIGHGHDHKDFRIIEGRHFNEIAEESVTPAEKAYARKLAKAQMVAEVSIMLSGKPFDHDRHGGQQRITGNHIGQFDFGAMAMVAPSDRQKQMIGHALGGIIKQHFVMERPLEQALRSEMDRIPTTEEEKDFIASIERGVLALGNFKASLGEKTGLGDIIGAAYVNGHVDPVIEQAMKDRLPGISKQVFGQLRQMGNNSEIHIHTAPHQFEASKDPAGLQKPPKESFSEKLPVRPRHIREAVGDWAKTKFGEEAKPDATPPLWVDQANEGGKNVLFVNKIANDPSSRVPGADYDLYPTGSKNR